MIWNLVLVGVLHNVGGLKDIMSVEHFLEGLEQGVPFINAKPKFNLALVFMKCIGSFPLLSVSLHKHICDSVVIPLL